MSDSDSVTNGYGHHSADAPLDVRKSGSASPNLDELSEVDADLFGDDDGEAGEQNLRLRKLEDSELDSGDDEGRQDRIAPTVEDDMLDDQDEERKEVRVMPAEIARINPPEADELYLLSMPSFLGLSQKRFEPTTYEPPKKGHGTDTPDAHFSPFSTASTSLHWRRDPKDHTKLQANSRIIRWSDGSLTLQIASSPKDQYKISAQALRQSYGKKTQKLPASQTDYDPSKDAQFYLAAEHAQVPSVHQIVAPLDAALKILPTGDQADESVLKLQQSLAAATNVHDPLTALKQVKEDPELAKRAAELYEKDRMRTSRRRELAEEKLLVRKERVLGRGGLGRSGLNVSGLEDEDGMRGTKGRQGGRGAKARRRTNHHGEIYSDDEDEGMPRGRTREDEYDLNDDFMAASDEEPEIYEEDEDEEEELEDEEDGEGEVEERPAKEKIGSGREKEKNNRAVTPKRALEDDDGEDVGAGGGAGSPGQTRKKRKVIVDDDEDE